MKKTLPIGTVAKMLGMSSEALRFYERKRIVDISADNDNGYRYYERATVTHLMKARFLKSMEFSLAEVNEQNSQGVIRIDSHTYVKGFPLSYWQQTIEKRKEHLQLEIEQKQRILSVLSDYQVQVENIHSMLGKYRIEYSPEMIYVGFSDENDEMPNSPEIVGLINACMDLFPASRYAFICPKESLSRDNANFRRGLLIPLAEKSRLAAFSTGIVTLCSVLCLHTLVNIDVNLAASSSMLRGAVDYLEKHSYSAAADAFGMWIANAQDGGRNEKYFEVWIPISAY